MKNILITSLVILTSSSALATTSLWDGAQTGVWGATTGWVVDGTMTPSGTPNGIDDVALFDNGSFYAGWGSISLETAGDPAADLDVTLGQWNQSGSSSGRHVDVRTSGSAKIIFDVSSGSAAINNSAGASSSGTTFNVEVQLNDNLVVNPTGNTGVGYREGITFNGLVTESGASRSITKNGIGSLSFEGTDGANTFSGGLNITNGLVQGMKTGAFGSGNIRVEESSGTSTASLEITDGVVDAISDSGLLYLGSFGGTNFSTVALADGVNETIGGLYFDNVLQAFGTWGATGSGATFINDDWFSGTGVLTVVPEPSTYTLLLGLFVFVSIALKRRGK
ncbi:hypothetical protein QEH52_02335 [Coraliomargarita sp. SDUM461003]|uniref:PEP-CTERM protein-sorting domain-containing protein n=1 Tax=Thalassobacterium maritimum TaxID=3041265 RepID=A0ABU1AQ91_9BACT|nr:PEP-CTERM sorting domain-containing protein [Coraliomargarita sp. SDUM461003]MDQ8206329.1 hypothetical protein [Coraliomargarita sp. SDUM461003]